MAARHPKYYRPSRDAASVKASTTKRRRASLRAANDVKKLDALLEKIGKDAVIWRQRLKSAGSADYNSVRQIQDAMMSWLRNSAKEVDHA